MSIKLLVADDSITIQKVIGIIFGGDDYSLTVVDNGKTAIEKAREICPDVLLIDALMPGMTGYEVSEAVRATPALANKPILILTGSFEPFDEDKAKKCGADDFLAKPFESQQIISKVRELAELGLAREKTAMAAQQPVAPKTEPEPSPVFAPASAFDFTQPAETPQSISQSDIWEAFTPEVESESASLSAVPSAVNPATASTPFEFSTDPDVFAIVNEESDSQLVQPAAAAAGSTIQSTGSQWIPVEEHTFEFEEEAIAEHPKSAFTEHAEPKMESSFGDISFEDEEPVKPGTFAAPVSAPVTETAAPAPRFAETAFSSFDEPAASFTPQTAAFEEPVVPVVQAAAPLLSPEPPPVAVAPVTAAAPVELTEDQLKAAISVASKEVIERIVWEVVPDLAEALIKEAIRKIKEGI